MISNRLKSLVKYINHDDQLIDVGADHSLLGIYLIKNNYLNKMIVSDINQQALESGIENIKKYNLKDKIEARLGNGIEVINKDINTALISGMGTKTIINILSHSNLKHLNKLIIQSNNDYDLLRDKVTKMGFYITDEEIISDKGKYYINIIFKRGNRVYSNDELKYGPILINNNHEYFSYLLTKEKAILNKIPSSKTTLRNKQIKTINELEMIIKRSKK